MCACVDGICLCLCSRLRAREQCQEVGHHWDCSFSPSHLKQCLAAQQADYGAKARNNEMVVAIKSVTSRLPHSVAGFWYTPTSGG